MTPKQGIHQISNAEYHKDSAMSKSSWTDFKDCPYVLYIKREHPEWFVTEKKAFDLGTAFHTMVLEPKEFWSVTVVQPADIKVRRGKAWDAFKAQHPGKTIITIKDKKVLDAMYESATSHPRFDELFPKESVNEMSFFWANEQYDFMQKCRPDGLPGNGVISSLKTAANSHPWPFGKVAGDLHYHWSAWLECHGVTRCTESLHDNYYLFVVEKVPPYQSVVYEFYGQDIEAARYQLEALYEKYDECLTNNVWPGYKDGQLSLPPYATYVEYDERRIYE